MGSCRLNVILTGKQWMDGLHCRAKEVSSLKPLCRCRPQGTRVAKGL